MSKLVVPSTVREFLKDLREPIELCDSEGHSLGEFTPRIAQPERRYYEPPPLTPEEWKEIESQESYSPEEVWAYVEKQ